MELNGLFTVDQVCELLRSLAPPALAEQWDNVGLLVGWAERPIHSVMTCLTVTPDVVAEAVAQQAGLIVTHHPLPFRPLKRIESGDVTGRMLLDLIEAGISVYSAHTAFDSAREGINQALAELLSLRDVAPLTPASDEDSVLGAGRYGELSPPRPLRQVADELKAALNIQKLQVVGPLEAPATRIGIACGSGGELLAPARQHGCDTFLTGEATFHRCLEAEAYGIRLLLVGHYASERFGVERLAGVLAANFPGLRVWASADERDPLGWL